MFFYSTEQIIVLMSCTAYCIYTFGKCIGKLQGVEMDENTVKSLKKLHDSAWKKAKKKCPQIDVNKVIAYAKLLMDGDKSAADIAKDLNILYKDAAVLYIKEITKAELNELLSESDNEILHKLAKDKFADTLVKSADKTFKVLNKYAKGQITSEQLAAQLCNTGVYEVAVKILKGCGLDPQELSRDPNLLKFASPTVAYQASLAAYQELRKALDDLELAREERAIIEEECAASIELIRTYRQEMEERVSQYLSRYLEDFNEGFRTMDEAILNNDIDGYIKGNVVIQQALGYEVQFTNQEEFDELMDSDEAFKL